MVLEKIVPAGGVTLTQGFLMHVKISSRISFPVIYGNPRPYSGSAMANGEKHTISQSRIWSALMTKMPGG
jgi:hypothetical protein